MFHHPWLAWLQTILKCKYYIARFFHDGSTTGFRRDELLALISRLSDLIEWFGMQKCALFVSSSLLVVYDVCEDNRQCEAARLTVRMIDFTHSDLQSKATVSVVWSLVYYLYRISAC